MVLHRYDSIQSVIPIRDAVMCDHNGEYTIYTRVAGYGSTRVYNCCICGVQMALDTLPQYLLKRMYGVPTKSNTVDNLPLVDFCVVLSGVNALPLSRIFFWTLQQTTSLEGVTFHLINKDIPGEEFHKIIEMVPKCNTYTRPPVLNTIMDRNVGPYKNLLELDTEWSCNWTVGNCGVNKFVVLSHFDIVFLQDFLSYLRSRATHRTGMLGQHCPFMLLNRDAFSQSCFKFRAEGPFKAIINKQVPREFNLYHPADTRVTDDALQTGFDTGELLELELRTMGWECDPLRSEFDRHFYHFSGGGRVNSGHEFNTIQRRTKMFIEEYNVPEIDQVRL